METEGFRLKTTEIAWILAFIIPQSAALTAPFPREPRVMKSDDCYNASLVKGGGSAYAETEGFRLKTTEIVWNLPFIIPQSAYADSSLSKGAKRSVTSRWRRRDSV